MPPRNRLGTDRADIEFARELIQKWVGTITTYMVRSRNTVLRKEIAPWFEQVMNTQGESLANCYQLKTKKKFRPKIPQAMVNMLPDLSEISDQDLCAAVVLFYIRGWLYARSMDASKRDYASFTGREAQATDFNRLMANWIDDVNLKLTRHINKRDEEDDRMQAAGEDDDEETEDDEPDVRREASSRDVRKRRRENVFVPEEDITQTEIYYPNSIINDLPNCFAQTDRKVFENKTVDEELRDRQLSILGVPRQFAQEHSYADSLQYPTELQEELFPLTLDRFHSPCAVAMLWNFYQLVKKPPDRRKILLPVGLNRANVTDEYRALVRTERAALLLRQAIMFYTSGYCMIQSGLILNSGQVDGRQTSLSQTGTIRVNSKKPSKKTTKSVQKPPKTPKFKTLNEKALKELKNWRKIKPLRTLVQNQELVATGSKAQRDLFALLASVYGRNELYELEHAIDVDEPLSEKVDRAQTTRHILQDEINFIKGVKEGHADADTLDVRLRQLEKMLAKLKGRTLSKKVSELKGVVRGSSLIVRGFSRVFNLTNSQTVASHELKPDKRRKNKDQDAVMRSVHRCAIFRTPSALKVLLVDGAELDPEPVPPCDIFMEKTSAASALLLAYMELVDFMFSPSAPLMTRAQLLTVDGYWGPNNEPFAQGENYKSWKEDHKRAFRDAYRVQMKKWTNVGFQPTGERSKIHGMPLMNWNDWAPGKDEFANPWRVREDNYFRLLMKDIPLEITNRLSIGGRAERMWASLETSGPFGTNRRPPLHLCSDLGDLYERGDTINRRPEEPSKMNRKRQDMRERVWNAVNDISEHFTDGIRPQLGVDYYNTAFLTKPKFNPWFGIKLNPDCMFPQPQRPLETFKPPALFNMNAHPLTDVELETSVFEPIPNMPEQWFVYPLNRLDAGLINGQQFRSGVTVTPRSDQAGFIVDYDITLRTEPDVWDLTVPLKLLVGADFKCKKTFREST